MHKLDHVGIAVRDLNAEIARYTQDLGCTLHLKEDLPEQKVSLAFLKLPNTLIELLMPTDPSSTLQKFLDKRGPGLHHICYQVPDIVTELQRFKSLGYQLIDETPRRGAENSLIAFIHPKDNGGVLTELCQRA